MKKIPFNISYRDKIESGKVQVVTRNDKPVRIVCWNAKGNNPIIGLVTEKSGNELCYSFDINGISCEDLVSDPDFLFILIEESHELTEFEETLKGIVNGFGSDVMTNEGAKNAGAQLLSIARKELMLDCGAKYNEGRTVGIELGKIEAMKDMPRWKSYEGGSPLSDYELGIENLYFKDMYIKLSDLEKLPKEE